MTTRRGDSRAPKDPRPPAAPGLWLDVALFPLIVTTIEGPVDPASWERYRARFDREVIGRQQRVVAIFDMSGLTNIPDSRTRTLIADWSRENEAFGREYHCGLAIVAPNPLARALMKVLHWTVPPAVPTSFEANRADAMRFCMERLRESGIDTAGIDGIIGA